MIPAKTAALATALDEKASKRDGYTRTPAQDALKDLERSGSVVIGWRIACGLTDSTARDYRDWLRVVKSLAKAGILLSEERIPQKNGSPTMARGYWHETRNALRHADGKKGG